MNHKAIYKLYPNVVSISEAEGAFDAQGNKVQIDMDAVNAWVDPEAYKYKRQQAYPSIVDQLDILYHSGFDGWKSAIQAIKEEFPK
jgi:hypothetical protein